MPKIKNLRLKDYKGTTLLEKFEIAEMGILAGAARPGWLIRRLSGMLHQPTLPNVPKEDGGPALRPPMRAPTLDEEGTKFLQMCYEAISKGNSWFFTQCATMVELIKERMDAGRKQLNQEVGMENKRRREKNQSPIDSGLLSGSLWIRAMRPANERGYKVLQTLLAISKVLGRDAKVQIRKLLEGLNQLYPLPDDKRYGERNIRGIVRELDLPAFPIPLAEFWDLEHGSVELRNNLLDTLLHIAKKQKRSATIDKVELMVALQQRHHRDCGYEDFLVEDTLKKMGIPCWPIQLAKFRDMKHGKPAKEGRGRKTPARKVKSDRRKRAA
jgi:hypothetical protein